MSIPQLTNGNASIIRWIVGVVGTLFTLGIAGMVSWNFGKIIELSDRVTKIEAATPIQIQSLSNGQQKRYTSDDALRDRASYEYRFMADEARLDALEQRRH